MSGTTMRLHDHASGRPHRPVLGMTMAAAVLVTLGACSSPGASAPAATPQASAAHSAASPPASASASAAATVTSALSGKWSGQYSGAYQGTFTLSWQQAGSRLSGSIRLSAPAVTLAIHGNVTGG